MRRGARHPLSLDTFIFKSYGPPRASTRCRYCRSLSPTPTVIDAAKTPAPGHPISWYFPDKSSLLWRGGHARLGIDHEYRVWGAGIDPRPSPKILLFTALFWKSRHPLSLHLKIVLSGLLSATTLSSSLYHSFPPLLISTIVTLIITITTIIYDIIPTFLPNSNLPFFLFFSLIH